MTEPTEHRPEARATVVVLTAGTIVSVAVFAAAFVVRLLGQPSSSDAIGTLGVVCLLATPAVALVSTAVELRRIQRSALHMLAMLVS